MSKGKILLMAALLIPAVVNAQEVKDPIPDGTQGNVFREVTDSVQKQVPVLKGHEFDGPWSSLKFGGGFLYEYAGFEQDEINKEQVVAKSDFKVRDFRVVVSGILKTKRQITWKAGLMYEGDQKAWLMRESGVMFTLPEIKGNVFIGRTKEGYSLSKIMNGYSIWFMERMAVIDVVPILADGIKYMGFFPKQKIFWNVGAFTDWFSEGQSFSTYNWSFATRVAWLPVYTDMVKPVLHIGVGYRYGEVTNGVIRVRSKPEVSGAPFYVDTESFLTENSSSVNGEVYYRTGSLTLGSEVHAHMFQTPDQEDPMFVGAEVFAAYVITGEVRPYYSSGGIFGFVRVKKPVTHGGPGTFEALLRFSNIDLEEGAIQGGKFWRITPGVNWYLSDNIRLFVQYGYTVLDKEGKSGVSNIFQSRIMFYL